MIVDGYSHVLPLDRLCELAGAYGPPELFGQSPIVADPHTADHPGRAAAVLPLDHGRVCAPD